MGLIKFIHLIIAMGLLSLTGYCISYTRSPSVLQRMHPLLLLLAPAAMISGALLVHPKHFTFHTPWIEAAILLSVLFIMGIALLTLLKSYIWVSKIAYVLLLCLLILIAHDAMNKTTFLF